MSTSRLKASSTRFTFPYFLNGIVSRNILSKPNGSCRLGSIIHCRRTRPPAVVSYIVLKPVKPDKLECSIILFHPITKGFVLITRSSIRLIQSDPRMVRGTHAVSPSLRQLLFFRVPLKVWILCRFAFV